MLEPFLGFIRAHSLVAANLGLRSAAHSDSLSWSGQDNIKVHSENTGVWVVLHAQVNMFCYTEPEVAGVTKVASLQLVLLDLEAFLEDVLGLLASDGHVTGDFVISADSERSDGVSGFRGQWGLAGQVLKDFARLGDLVSGFSHGDIEDKFLDLYVAHRVFLGGHL